TVPAILSRCDAKIGIIGAWTWRFVGSTRWLGDGLGAARPQTILSTRTLERMPPNDMEFSGERSESAAMMKWTPPGERTASECHTPETRGSEGGVHERSYDHRGRHRQERIRDRRLGGAGPRSRAAATFAAPDDQMVRESSGVDGGDGGLRIRAPSRTAFRELRAPGGAAAAGAGAALRAAQQDGSNRHDGATGGTSERRHRGGAGEDDPSAEPLGDASAENGVERDADGATERATRCAARVRDRDRGRRDEGAARGGRGDLEGRSARSPARAADRGDGGDQRARREDRQGRARVGDSSRGPAGIRAGA